MINPVFDALWSLAQPLNWTIGICENFLNQENYSYGNLYNSLKTCKILPIIIYFYSQADV